MPAGKTRIGYSKTHKYVISTPNEGYSGMTEGLLFTNGQATIDPDMTWKNAVPDRTPEQTLDRIQDEHPEYTIEVVTGRYHPVPDTADLRDESGALRTKKSKKAQAEAEPTEE